MTEHESFRVAVSEMRAEPGASGFAALMRQEGDAIRRDVFTVIEPGGTASGRIQAGYTTVYPGCATRGHTHADREEVYYFTRGQGVMVADGEETPVGAGDTLYLKPGPFHVARNTGDLPFEYFWITIVA